MTTPTPLAAVCYPLALRHLGRGRVDLLNTDLFLLLATAAYTPADTDEWLSAVQPYEAAGAGYPAGGAALTGRAFDLDSSGRAVLACDPVVFASASFVARHAVVYAAVGGDPGTSPLLSHVDFATDLDPAGTTFTAAFPAGVLRLARPA